MSRRRRFRSQPDVEKRLRRRRAAALELPAPVVWTRILRQELSTRLGCPLVLTLTDNLHSLASFRAQDGRYDARLHHMFLHAPPTVLDGVAAWMTGRESPAVSEVDRFIEDHTYLVRRESPRERRRRVPVSPRGRHHDLQRIFDRLNRRLFRGEVRGSVTWARVARVSRPRQSIKLGSFSARSRVIRVHPALDHPRVPAYFVEAVVHHEMLHALEPPSAASGRREVHGPRFREREARFPEQARAEAWERENLDWLLAWPG